MKNQIKPVMAAGCVAVVSIMISTAATEGGPLDISGTSILADVNGTATGPEALTVAWSVVENGSGIYTYSYDISNPANDVQLAGAYNPGASEYFDSFTVSFDAAAPGAVLGSPTGAPVSLNLGSGVFWFIPSGVLAGASTGPLSFQSDLGPTWGVASAADDSPPSPWSSSPSGQSVPVPAPDEMNTLMATAVAFLILGFGSQLAAPRMSRCRCQVERSLRQDKP
jgi:hypothetical protein